MTRPGPRRSGQVQAEKPAPTARPGEESLAELPPDAPEALGPGMSWAWRVTVLVWAGMFLFLLAYELLSALFKILFRK